MANAVLEWLLDLLYPPRCMICHRLLEPGKKEICAACDDTLPEYDGADPKVRFCERCVVTFYYEGTFRASFLRYKFSGLRQYAGRYGKWMAVTIRDKLAGQYDLITYAPVSRKRRKERGYDQSELLCRAIAQELGMAPVRTLEKQTDIPAQSTLHEYASRVANVSGVYAPVEPEQFMGKRVLLIDDIVTTGATLSECCRVLLSAGAKSVVCAALATRCSLE